MKVIIILSIICFILFLGLLWCIKSIRGIYRKVYSILREMALYDKMLGLED